MSKKFYAVNRETGEKWKPNARHKEKQYLMMYDSGYLAIIIEYVNSIGIYPLDPKIWKTVIKENTKEN